MPTQLHNTILLVADQQCSVLSVLDQQHPHPIAYTAYGHHPRENGLLSLLGFNGEYSDPLTRHYLLGNGYRAFNPVLMRFNSPDSWSPFGEGGLNAYGYCVGDPVNRVDPTGHANWLVKLFRNIGRRVTHPFRAPTVSPPRSPRTSLASTSGDDLSSLNQEQLLRDIRHLENKASMQRSILNDIENGFLPTSSEGNTQRVNAWRLTEERIARRKALIPPPSYAKALNAPSPESANDGLPTYTWTIRNT
ncbi:hypothetical protein DM828_27965 [Pseudomonas umsongensis]|jgi:RHS repeat-associated protein|nr:hypothetical protein [Pseudomonas umsongensis]